MKTTQLRLSAIAIALAALSQTVSAQDVKVYGVLDLGVANTKTASNTPSVTEMTSYNTSRLGFKGTEDLGDGLKAQFQLESEIAADTGMADTAFFGRQAWAGLADSWGAVRFGRTKSLYDGLSDYIDPFGNNGIVGKYTTSVWRVEVAKSRISNGIQYASPKWHGLRVSAQMSMDEVHGGQTGSGVSAEYEFGGFTGIAATDKPVVTKEGDPQPSAWLVGGRYTTGPLTFSLAHNEGDTKSVKKSGGQYKGDTVGFEWAIGSGVVKASYGRMSQELEDAKTKITNKTKKIEVAGLGYEYALSKRTTLYTAAVKEDVSTGSGFSAGITHRF